MGRPQPDNGVMSHVTCQTSPGIRDALHGRIVGLALLLTLGAAVARADDSTEVKPATVRKVQGNLGFQLPPDWPIERRGGIVGPIPVEEYLAMKFNALEAHLQAIEQTLNGLDLRVRVLEEHEKKSAASLKSSEARPAP